MVILEEKNLIGKKLFKCDIKVDFIIEEKDMSVYCELRTNGKVLNEFYNRETKEYSFTNFIEKPIYSMYNAMRCGVDCLAFDSSGFPKDVIVKLIEKYPDKEIILDFHSEYRGKRKLIYKNGEITYKDEKTLEKETIKAIREIDISKADTSNICIVSYDQNRSHNYEEEAEEENE